MSDAPRIARLYRYPVKGLSPEPRRSLELTAGQGVPFDRIFALARPTTSFDASAPVALPKQKFFMLQRDEVLACVTSRYDDRTGQLYLAHDGDELVADLAVAGDRTKVEDFVAAVLAPSGAEGRPRLVGAHGDHRFTDTGVGPPGYMQAISVINLATVRELAERIGTPVDPLRFRANVYIDGVEPWAELGWMDHTLELGAAVTRFLARTPRCAATTVNPDTGIRDIRMLKELSSHYGHTDCGFYVTVQSGATIRPGDPVTVLDAGTPAQASRR